MTTSPRYPTREQPSPSVLSTELLLMELIDDLVDRTIDLGFAQASNEGPTEAEENACTTAYDKVRVAIRLTRLIEHDLK